MALVAGDPGRDAHRGTAEEVLGDVQGVEHVGQHATTGGDRIVAPVRRRVPGPRQVDHPEVVRRRRDRLISPESMIRRRR
jgi:hypothetical protein